MSHTGCVFKTKKFGLEERLRELEAGLAGTGPESEPWHCLHDPCGSQLQRFS